MCVVMAATDMAYVQKYGSCNIVALVAWIAVLVNSYDAHKLLQQQHNSWSGLWSQLSYWRAKRTDGQDGGVVTGGNGNQVHVRGPKRQCQGCQLARRK